MTTPIEASRLPSSASTVSSPTPPSAEAIGVGHLALSLRSVSTESNTTPESSWITLLDIIGADRTGAPNGRAEVVLEEGQALLTKLNNGDKTVVNKIAGTIAKISNLLEDLSKALKDYEDTHPEKDATGQKAVTDATKLNAQLTYIKDKLKLHPDAAFAAQEKPAQEKPAQEEPTQVGHAAAPTSDELQLAAKLIAEDASLLDVAYKGHAPNRFGTGLRDGIVSWSDIKARSHESQISPALKKGLGNITREVFDQLRGGERMISLADLAKRYDLTLPTPQPADKPTLEKVALAILKDQKALDIANKNHPGNQSKDGADGRISASDLMARLNDPTIHHSTKTAIESVTPEIFDALRGDNPWISIQDLQGRFGSEEGTQA